MKTAKIITVIIVLVVGLLPLEGTIPSVQAAPTKVDLPNKLFLPIIELIPEPPTLLSPLNNSMNYEWIDLTWSVVPGACAYSIFAASGFFQFEEERETPLYQFLDPGNWAWKVRAVYCHNDGVKTYGPWSVTWKFTEYPHQFKTPPELLDPIDGIELRSGKPPVFYLSQAKWGYNANMIYQHDLVQIQLSTDPTFSELFWETTSAYLVQGSNGHLFTFDRSVEVSFSDETFTILDPMPTGTYFWKAREIAADGVTISNWTPVFSFTIKAPFTDCIAPGEVAWFVSSSRLPGEPHIGYLFYNNNTPEPGDVVHLWVEAGVWEPQVYTIDRVTFQAIFNTGITEEYEASLYQSLDPFTGRWQADIPILGSGCYDFIIRAYVHNPVGSQRFTVENKPLY